MLSGTKWPSGTGHTPERMRLADPAIPPHVATDRMCPAALSVVVAFVSRKLAIAISCRREQEFTAIL
jgi:hypothetical protein